MHCCHLVQSTSHQSWHVSALDIQGSMWRLIIPIMIQNREVTSPLHPTKYTSWQWSAHRVFCFIVIIPRLPPSCNTCQYVNESYCPSFMVDNFFLYITLNNGVDNWKQNISGMHCFPTMATIIHGGHPPPSDICQYIWNLYFYVSSINDT